MLQQGVVTYAMLAEGRGTSEPAARKWASRAGERLITVTRDGKVLEAADREDRTAVELAVDGLIQE